MEALNAARLRPISALPSSRKPDLRKSPTLSPLPQHRSSSTSPTRIHGGLALLSSALAPLAAGALTYDEALQQSLDASSPLDSVVSFVAEYPVLLAGGAVLLAVPLVLSQLLKKPKAFGVESARNAYARLGEDAGAQLVDIRGSAEARKVGSPDVRGLGKKTIGIAYNGEDKTGFLRKLGLRLKEPENTTLFVLDKFDGNSELVAELATVNGFKSAYAIKDGAEGPRGWLNSGLPWIAPKKGLSFDLSNLTEALNGVVGEGVDGLPVALGFGAAAGLGFLAYTEIDTILVYLGTAAIIQLVSKKLLFAEDRKKTLQQVDMFLSTEIAPTEFVDDVKQIGKAILPTLVSKALPPPSTETESPSPPEAKAEIVPETKVEAKAEPAKEVNSVPSSEETPKPAPHFSSPFPYYPDFKPPASPTPTPP